MEGVFKLDEFKAHMQDIATILADYHKDLVKKGFTDEQAFILAKDYQNSLFGSAREES